MRCEGWMYYNHAAVPTTAPHELPNMNPIKDRSIWHTGGGTPLLARWTTDFDCGHETNWWYVIKDTPFDICELKSKRRYEINKGNKYFEIKKINSESYVNELFDIRSRNMEVYPARYRQTIDAEIWYDEIRKFSSNYSVYGAFDRETGMLCGYANVSIQGKCANLVEVKVFPACEKQAIHASIVDGVLRDFSDFLKDGYICDGARNINHETAYQDYLEKYFGFRKAYCKLNIAYNPKIGWAVKLLFPFRGILKKFDNLKIVHLTNAVLKMEEFAREQNC